MHTTKNGDLSLQKSKIEEVIVKALDKFTYPKIKSLQNNKYSQISKAKRMEQESHTYTEKNNLLKRRTC